MSKCYLYILKGVLRSGKYQFYKGITNCIERRMMEHLMGYNKSTKRYHGNIKLVYLELYESKSLAMRRELQVKKLNRKQLRFLIEQLSRKEFQDLINKINMEIFNK